MYGRCLRAEIRILVLPALLSRSLPLSLSLSLSLSSPKPLPPPMFLPLSHTHLVVPGLGDSGVLPLGGIDIKHVPLALLFHPRHPLRHLLLVSQPAEAHTRRENTA